MTCAWAFQAHHRCLHNNANPRPNKAAMAAKAQWQVSGGWNGHHVQRNQGRRSIAPSLEEVTRHRNPALNVDKFKGDFSTRASGKKKVTPRATTEATRIGANGTASFFITGQGVFRGARQTYDASQCKIEGRDTDADGQKGHGGQLRPGYYGRGPHEDGEDRKWPRHPAGRPAAGHQKVYKGSDGRQRAVGGPGRGAGDGADQSSSRDFQWPVLPFGAWWPRSSKIEGNKVPGQGLRLSSAKLPAAVPHKREGRGGRGARRQRAREVSGRLHDKMFAHSGRRLIRASLEKVRRSEIGSTCRGSSSLDLDFGGKVQGRSVQQGDVEYANGLQGPGPASARRFSSTAK